MEYLLERGLTVGDLITELEALDRDAKVVFACDYGDYHHTRQVLPVERVEPLSRDEYLATTAYSQSRVCVRERGEEKDREEAEEAFHRETKESQVPEAQTVTQMLLASPIKPVTLRKSQAVSR